MALGRRIRRRPGGRPPPRAPRDYKAEYARRKARGAAAGKTPAEARGHAREKEEKSRRRRRYREEYGASPETMAKLRKAALAHILRELDAVGTKGAVNPDILRENLRHASAAALRKLLEEDGYDLKSGAGLTYEQTAEADPDFENDAGINFRWYGSKSGGFGAVASGTRRAA